MDALNRKEAIIMGDDITPVTREEYCLKELAAGGGGGLDYVIPEQTVTLTGSTNFVEIEADFSSIIETNNSPILAFTQTEDGYVYKTYLQLLYTNEYEWSGENMDGIQAVVKNENGVWKFNITTRITYPLETTISAIRGF